MDPAQAGPPRAENLGSKVGMHSAIGMNMPSRLLSPATVFLALTMLQRTAAAQTSTESTSDKSPGLALGLSVGLPLVGAGMIAAAALPASYNHTWQTLSMLGGLGLVLLGPSGGNFYIGRIPRGFAFSGGRLALTALAAALIAEGIRHSDVSESDYERGAAKTSMIGAFACGAGILGLTIWETIDAYYATKRLNRAKQQTLAFAPMIVPGREGTFVAGMAVAGRY
jgi:hypothetical protein